MKNILDLVLEALAKSARERALLELDERTLRDVGLQIEANRARERSRLALRFGGY